MATHADFARELLALGRDDATAASILAATDASADAIVGFHAQQAVEKSLKAVLALHGQDFSLSSSTWSRRWGAHYRTLWSASTSSRPSG